MTYVYGKIEIYVWQDSNECLGLGLVEFKTVNSKVNSRRVKQTAVHFARLVGFTVLGPGLVIPSLIRHVRALQFGATLSQLSSAFSLLGLEYDSKSCITTREVRFL